MSDEATSAWRRSLRRTDGPFIPPEHSPFEMVERKGIGHPGTLAELLADEFIRRYAEYAIGQIGAIPNVSTDKTMVMSPAGDLRFGSHSIERHGQITLAGKITKQVGSHSIPVDDLFRDSVAAVLTQADLKDLMDHVSLSVVNNNRLTDDHATQVYRPTSVDTIRPSDPTQWTCADTAWLSFEGPLTPVERLVIDLERELAGAQFRRNGPEFGTGTTILAIRQGCHVDITISLPLKAALVGSRSEYNTSMEKAHVAVHAIIDRYVGPLRVDWRLNTDYPDGVLLTAFGSSVDNGDHWAVGNGNGPLGVHSSERWASAEVVAGKNPFNHPAKIYTEICRAAVQKWQDHSAVPIRTAVTCRNGEPLVRPGNVFVQLGDGRSSDDDRSEAFDVVADCGEDHLARLGDLSTQIALRDPLDEFRRPA